MVLNECSFSLTLHPLHMFTVVCEFPILENQTYLNLILTVVLIWLP